MAGNFLTRYRSINKHLCLWAYLLDVKLILELLDLLSISISLRCINVCMVMSELFVN